MAQIPTLPITGLELFSTELFVEIFHFMNGYNIYQAFYGLNDRLTTLVLTYGMKYIDLREITLWDSRKMLSITNCSDVKTLKLSDKYNNEQIEQLLDTNAFPLSNFNSLRSLTLDSIGLYSLHFITQQRFDLNQLESLTILLRSDLCTEKVLDMYRAIMNGFCCRFPSFKFLYLSIANVHETIFNNKLTSYGPVSSSMEISASLQCLIIDHIQINDIEKILSRLPNLSRLVALIKLNPLISTYPLVSKLTCCVLTILSSEFNSLSNLLKACPNLQQLTLSFNPGHDDALDSHQWKDLIENGLLKLKRFTVYMVIMFISIDAIRDLVTSGFTQSKFWSERKTKVDIVEEESMNAYGLQTGVTIEFNI